MSRVRALPTVQLLHELPDGSRHVDWMIGQDPEGREPLITFRLPGRLDGLHGGAELPAERLADHRPAYLAYEGPVSGDRGRVTRLARGEVSALERGPAAWRISVRWEAGGGQHLVLTPTGPTSWRIGVVGSTPPV